MTPGAISGQRSLQQVASNVVLNKICTAASYAALAYIYQPATALSMELTSAQSLLLGILHSLVRGDITSLSMLAGICSSLPQLRSRFLRLWLLDDFNFPQQDIEAAMSSLSQFLASGALKLPYHVGELLTALASKYGLSGVHFPYFSEGENIIFEDHLERAVVSNSPGDIIALAMTGRDVNRKMKSGDSLFHLAVSSRCPESIAALGYLKADVNVLNSARVTPLQQAVLEDNVPAIRALMLCGADTKRKVRKGDSMVHLAVARGNIRALRALLEVGAEIDDTNHLGETALMQAMKIGNTEAVEILLKKGADVNVANNGKRPLDIAMKMQSTLILEEGGVDADYLTKSGETLLHEAARYGCVEAVEDLLNRGVQPDIMNKSGFAPLHVTSHPQIAKMLIAAGCSINSTTTEEGKTALHLATAEGSLKMVMSLINQKADLEVRDSYGDTALSIAAASSKFQVLTVLIEAGACINVINKIGWTPLHRAAEVGSRECVYALAMCAHTRFRERTPNYKPDIRVTGDKVILQLTDIITKNEREKMLNVDDLKVFPRKTYQKTEINPKTVGGWTPLHVAAHRGHKKVVGILLNFGADISTATLIGSTVLHLAAVGNDDPELVEMLLTSGADINAETAAGETALYLAVEKSHSRVAMTLISKGADVFAMSEGWSVLHMAAASFVEKYVIEDLVRKGADISYRTVVTGRTPLHLAAEKGSYHLVLYLLDNGSDVAATSNSGVTALHVAAYKGHMRIVVELLRRGADVSARTSEGLTPLHLAASYSGSVDVVMFLIANGADISSRTPSNDTALTLAKINRQESIARFLSSLENS